MFLSENLSPLQGDVVLALTGASVLPDPQVVHREPRAAYLSVVIVKRPGLGGQDWQEEVAWSQNNEQVALARTVSMTVFLGGRLPLCEFSVTTGDWFSYSKKHQNL